MKTKSFKGFWVYDFPVFPISFVFHLKFRIPNEDRNFLLIIYFLKI